MGFYKEAEENANLSHPETYEVHFDVIKTDPFIQYFVNIDWSARLSLDWVHNGSHNEFKSMSNMDLLVVRKHINLGNFIKDG